MEFRTFKAEVINELCKQLNINTTSNTVSDVINESKRLNLTSEVLLYFMSERLIPPSTKLAMFVEPDAGYMTEYKAEFKEEVKEEIKEEVKENPVIKKTHKAKKK